MNKFVLSIVCALIIIVVSTSLGIVLAMNYECSIIKTTRIRVSQVNVKYEWWPMSCYITTVIGYDSTSQLVFWDNVSDCFMPNHTYFIVYHTDYRSGAGHSTLVSIDDQTT